MIWKIEEAQQQFPEIINASGETPQLIYQRDRPKVLPNKNFQDLKSFFQSCRLSSSTLSTSILIGSVQKTHN